MIETINQHDVLKRSVFGGENIFAETSRLFEVDGPSSQHRQSKLLHLELATRLRKRLNRLQYLV